MNLPSGWLRLIIGSLLAIPLAVFSGAHALSSASLRGAPELALAVFPVNGLASERLAYRALTAGIRPTSGQPGGIDPDEAIDTRRSALSLANRSAGLAQSAVSAASAAREAIATEPLSPRAFAILALAQEDDEQKTAIVTRAAQLSRRDLVLQALVLEQRGESGDYIGAIDTIDEILRVHPERQAEFFPILVEALEVDAAVPGFARLLARPLPWREAFLGYAVAQPGALDNLAVVRDRIGARNKELDRRLIAGLAESGRLEMAERIYRRAGGTGVVDGNATILNWHADYPPFDWKLADQSGFRAQIGDTPDQLEIDIAPGNGGVIASRLVRNLRQPLLLRIAHDIEPTSQIADMRLTITCAGQTELLLDRPFTGGTSAFFLERVPTCPYLTIAIMGRSWTGTRALSGTLSPFQITFETL